MITLEMRINAILEQFTIEEVLEEFDIQPIEVFELLFDAGLLDERLLNNLTPVYSEGK